MAATVHVTTSETWNDNDSEFATTGRISIPDTEIAHATTIMHTTGAESMAGVKTFTNGVTIPGGTLTVTDATITGANSDSIRRRFNPIYITQTPRARAAISVTDNPTAGNELSYNSPTGVISWNGTTAGASGSNTQIQFNDGGNLAGDSDFVFDKSTNRLTVTNLTVDSQFNLTSDYGSVASAVTVTDDFGSTANDTRMPTPHDSYTVTEAGSITGMSAGDMIFVSNETGGATMAFYDGSNWRRVSDRAVIS